MTNAQAYFSQTQKNDSQIWRWLMGFWFIILSWIAGQFLTILILLNTGIIAPEKLQDFMVVAGQTMSSENAGLLAISQFALLPAALGSIVFYILSRSLEGAARRVFAIITGICVAVGLLSIAYPMVASDQSDVNKLFMDLIGLSPVNYAFMLMTFIPIIGGAILVQKFIHHRTFVSLLTAATRFNWQRMFFTIGLTWAIFGVITLIAHFTGLSPLQYSFDPSRFLGFAIASLLFIPFQSAAEEIVFRGYLNQGLGHFISNKWVVFIITSAMFAAMHLSNPEAVAGAQEGPLSHLLTMSGYFLFGLFLSIVVYLEGGLEAAIGIHIANNLFAALFVNYEGSVLPTPTFFLATPDTTIDTPLMLLTLGIIIYVLYRTRKVLHAKTKPI